MMKFYCFAGDGLYGDEIGDIASIHVSKLDID